MPARHPGRPPPRGRHNNTNSGRREAKVLTVHIAAALPPGMIRRGVRIEGSYAMVDEPVRYAVVGLGRAGWGIHVHQLRGRADARIVAVVDPVEQRREQAHDEFNCKTYKDLGPMLSQAEVEVVVIATPSVAHAAETKRALKSGKHVVAEKPMAMSLAEVAWMIS